MNRAHLQRLARARLREAKVLLAGKCWSGAYYVSGYVVECGLKSCIIRHLMATDHFPERKYSEQCWTHSLPQLLSLAGLESILGADMAADPVLLRNWQIVKDWTEVSRYQFRPKRDAIAIYNAITNKKHAVFQWIKQRW